MLSEGIKWVPERIFWLSASHSHANLINLFVQFCDLQLTQHNVILISHKLKFSPSSRWVCAAGVWRAFRLNTSGLFLRQNLLCFLFFRKTDTTVVSKRKKCNVCCLLCIPGFINIKMFSERSGKAHTCCHVRREGWVHLGLLSAACSGTNTPATMENLPPLTAGFNRVTSC